MLQTAGAPWHEHRHEFWEHNQWRNASTHTGRGYGVIAVGLCISLALHAGFFSLELTPWRPPVTLPAASIQATLISLPAASNLVVPADAVVNQHRAEYPQAPQPAPKPARVKTVAKKPEPQARAAETHSANQRRPLQDADGYRQYYSESTLQTPPAPRAFGAVPNHPSIQQQGMMARTQRQLSATRNLHGDTYLETASGQCFKTLGNTPPGQATNWYATRCHNHKTDEEKMLENVQREMDQRFK